MMKNVRENGCVRSGNRSTKGSTISQTSSDPIICEMMNRGLSRSLQKTTTSFRHRGAGSCDKDRNVGYACRAEIALRTSASAFAATNVGHQPVLARRVLPGRQQPRVQSRRCESKSEILEMLMMLCLA